jgi:site-specific recombinase XerD
MSDNSVADFPQGKHTPGHVDCPICLPVKQRALMLFEPGMSFEQAADAFYSYRSVDDQRGYHASYVRPTTLAGYRNQLGSLSLFFGGMRLNDIHWWHMKSYQEARVAGAEPFIRRRRPHEEPRSLPVKPQQANQETSLLKRLKILAGCWTPEDEKLFCPLQEEESEVPRSLSPDEQGLWLEVARARKEWSLVYLYSLVAFDTCCSTNELRLLRLGNINLAQWMISVPWPAAKNKHRHRDIAIEDPDTMWAINELLARAAALCGSDPIRNPTHALFPFRSHKGPYNPTRAASSSFLKKDWEEVRKASGLTWFRPYDTRHTGATRLAENNWPIDVIMARMGHASEQMRRHYTHISQQAQRRWLRKSVSPVGTSGTWRPSFQQQNQKYA